MNSELRQAIAEFKTAAAVMLEEIEDPELMKKCAVRFKALRAAVDELADFVVKSYEERGQQ